MKEFIKKAQINHLIICTCLIFIVGVIYLLSLGSASLAGTIIGPDGFPMENTILSIAETHESTVSSSHGKFYINIPKRLSGGHTIAFSLKEKGMLPLFPPFGHYKISAVPETIKIKMIRSGDKETILLQENLFHLINYLEQDPSNRSLTTSTAGTSKKERDNRDKIIRINHYYDTEIDRNLNLFEKLSFDNDINRCKEVLSSDRKIESNDREPVRSITKKDLNKSANCYYFSGDYKKSQKFYKRIIDRWQMDDLNQQEHFTIHYQWINARLMYFVHGEKDIDYYASFDRNESLLKIGEQYNQLLNSSTAQKNVSNKAIIANSIAFLADYCDRHRLCESKINYNYGLDNAIRLLNSIPVDTLYQIDVNLWSDTINAMLILKSRVSQSSAQCNTKQLWDTIETALPAINNPPDSTYAILVDLPINLINALTILGDCDAQSAVDTYNKTIKLLNEFKKHPDFLEYANNNDRLTIEKKICDLYSKASNIQERKSAIKMIEDSIHCFRDLIENKQTIIKEMGRIEKMTFSADFKLSLANAYIKESFFLGFSEKSSRLNKSIELLKIAREFYERLGDKPYIADTLNSEGFALIEMADDKKLSRAEKQNILKNAKRLILDAYNFEKDNLHYIDSLAWVDFKLGHITKAKAKLEAALAKMEEQKVKPIGLVHIQSHLAEIYLYTGKMQEAFQMIDQIKKTNPNAYQLERINIILSEIDQQTLN